jgi:Baseplate J-like protein
MSAQYTPLEAPNLVQEVDLLPYVYATTQAVSQGAISDFSPHSPIAAMAEGLDFSMRELRYWLNQFAGAVAINHLKIAGVQRRLGAKAEVSLQFTLSAPIGNPFVLSAGYMASTEDGLEYLTKELLIIPSGAVSGTVAAIARDPGTQHNVPAYRITNLSESRAFLQGVTNLEPAAGGLDEEAQEEVLSRGFSALRYRGVLVTADDFEQEASKILGAGSVVKAVGALALDKQTFERGSVHLFCLNPDGTIPTAAQLTALKAAMQPIAPTFLQERKTTIMATALYLSPIDIQPLEIRAIATLLPGDNPEARAKAIYAEIGEYLRPGELPPGETIRIKEIELRVRQSGVRYLQSVSIRVPHPTLPNEFEVSYADYPLPNAWTSATLNRLIVELIDSEGNPYIYSYDVPGAAI